VQVRYVECAENRSARFGMISAFQQMLILSAITLLLSMTVIRMSRV
jgi:hypothetical protein